MFTDNFRKDALLSFLYQGLWVYINLKVIADMFTHFTFMML